jgi:hypothetical protein
MLAAIGGAAGPWLAGTLHDLTVRYSSNRVALPLALAESGAEVIPRTATLFPPKEAAPAATIAAGSVFFRKVVSRGTEGLQTRRWRKPDSNSPSHLNEKLR